MRRLGLTLFIGLVLLLPLASADFYSRDYDDYSLEEYDGFDSDLEGYAPVWRVEFENGYFTTTPVVYGNYIIARTSGYWMGEDRPQVSVYSTWNGNQKWTVVNENSTQHDMSQPLVISRDDHNCTYTRDFIAVAWANGEVQLLNATTGDEVWKYSSEVVTWGITGKLSYVDGELLVPTRKGVAILDLCSGEQLQYYETGLGWRNGIAINGDDFIIGDESGTLHILGENISNISLGDYKIRHTPIVSDWGIAIHAQASTSSTIFILNKSDYSIMQSFESGPSPAIPILVNGLLVTGDSDSLRVFDCSENCSQTSSIGVPVNGEIGFSYNAMITVGRNNADGGWKSYQLYDGKFLEHYRGYETNFSTYTTTYPVIFLDGKQEALVLANDAGVLAVYVDAEYNPNWLGPCTSGDMTLQKQLVAFVYLMMIAVPLVWLNLTNPQLFTKIATTLLLIMAILAIPQLSIDWSKGVDDVLSNESDEDQSQWNDEWPNEWLGTQVVVFELQGQTISSGGYFGHGDVYSLTQMAAQDLGIELEVEQTDIGVYVHSIDGQAGEGWEFFIDAKRASLSADNSQVESDSIIVWKLA